MSLAATILTKNIVEQTLDRACEIQAIPAPTFLEAQRAEYFRKQFNQMGLQDVQIDQVGNVLARLPGLQPEQQTKTRPLVVSAHMDTVHPLDTPLRLRRSADRISGPGIGDNALGLAALLSLVDLLHNNKVRLPGDLWLAISVGEEGLGNLYGIQAVVDRFGGDPLAYLVVEGMGLGTVLHRGLGVERYKISVQTPGGHSWVDYGDPSAIHELCAIVSRLTALSLPRSPCTSLNVGIIHGGTSINTIAANAWLELDLRSEDHKTLEALVSDMGMITRSAERSDVRIGVERIGKRSAGSIPEQHPLVRLSQSVLSDLDLEARLDIASTDANLPLSRGYPAICVGITNGNNAHTRDEYILTAPVGQGLAQLFLLVTQAWDRLS